MTNKLKCVAVDDDPFMLTILEDLCKEIPNIELVKTFTDPVEFVRSSSSLDYELCLLDIYMPTMDGLLVSQMIGDKAVIFITGEYAKLKDALKENHVAVILKPIEKYLLSRALEKAELFVSAKKNVKEEYMLFNIVGECIKLRLKLSDISYVSIEKTNRRHKHIYTNDGSHYKVKDCSLEDLKRKDTTLLQPNIHELVSKDAIHFVGRNNIVLKRNQENGKAKEIILARTFKGDFFAQM